MRIVLLVTDLQPGGTPLRIAAIARGLRSVGEEVAVGCLGPRGPVADALERDGIATFSCGARRPWNVAAIWRLRTNLRRLNPQIVHSTLMHANVAARFVCDLLRIPLLTSTATIEVERPWHVTMERLTAGWDSGHIVNGPGLAAHVVREFGRPRSNVFVVPPFLDRFPTMIDRVAARAALKLPQDARVVGWFGRFDPVKRMDLILRAAIELRDSGIHFVLAGDGPRREKTAREVKANRLSEFVHLPGWLDDPGTLLSAADVMLFPSITEGLPNAVLQSMWAGVPVIASDIPAHRDLSDREQRMTLVDLTVPNITAAVRRAFDEPTRGELLKRAAAASEWARSLSIADPIEQLRLRYAAIAWPRQDPANGSRLR